MSTEPPVFITTDEVAALLGFTSAAAFRHVRARLEDDDDFPLPMPHSRRPLRWRRDQVLGWIEAHGRPRTDMPSPEPTGRAPSPVKLRLIAEARSA